MSQDKANDQKYGIYIPELKVFLYVNSTKDQFVKLLSNSGLADQNKKIIQDTQQVFGGSLSLENDVETDNFEGNFNDFEKVVQQVALTPYDRFCEQLQQFDF